MRASWSHTLTSPPASACKVSFGCVCALLIVVLSYHMGRAEEILLSSPHENIPRVCFSPVQVLLQEDPFTTVPHRPRSERYDRASQVDCLHSRASAWIEECMLRPRLQALAFRCVFILLWRDRLVPITVPVYVPGNDHTSLEHTIFAPCEEQPMLETA